MKSLRQLLAFCLLFSTGLALAGGHGGDGDKTTTENGVPLYGPMPLSDIEKDPRYQDPSLDDPEETMENGKPILMNATRLYEMRKRNYEKRVTEKAKALLAQAEAKDHAEAGMESRFEKAKKRYVLLDQAITLMQSEQSKLRKQIEDEKDTPKDAAAQADFDQKVADSREMVKYIQILQWKKDAIQSTYTASYVLPPVHATGTDLESLDVAAKANELRLAQEINRAHGRYVAIGRSLDYPSNVQYAQLTQSANGRISLEGFIDTPYYYRNRKGEMTASTKWKKVVAYLTSEKEFYMKPNFETDWTDPGTMLADNTPLLDINGHARAIPGHGGVIPGGEKYSAAFVAGDDEEVETKVDPTKLKDRKAIVKKTAADEATESHAQSEPEEKRSTDARVPFQALAHSLASAQSSGTKYVLNGDKKSDLGLSAIYVKVKRSGDPRRSIQKAIPYTFDAKLGSSGEKTIDATNKLLSDDKLADEVLKLYKGELPASDLSSKAKRLLAFRTLIYSKFSAIRVDAGSEATAPHIEQPGNILVLTLAKGQKSIDYTTLRNFTRDLFANEEDPHPEIPKGKVQPSDDK